MGNSPQIDDTEDPTQSRYWVKSVGRAIDIMELLAQESENGGLSVTEIGSRLKLSKSAVFATLYTLTARELVRDTGIGMSRRYSLGMGLARLGAEAAASTSLRDAARPHLEKLAQEIGATARLASLAGGRAVVIEQATGNERVRLDLSLGSAEALHTTSLGKAILAQMSENKARKLLEETGMEQHTERTITNVDEFIEHLKLVHEQGYAINDEEDAHGVFGVASPVFGHSGSCLGAVTITGLKRQQPPDFYYEDMAKAVQVTAMAISRSLGYAEQG